MAKVELDVLFKKIQKDDKKEVLEFHILGDDVQHKSELIGMAGSIVIIEIGDVKLSAEMKSIQRDSKKVVLKFEAKGDSEEKTIQLYPRAGFNIKLLLEQSQMSIEDIDDGEDHEGLKYTVNGDGTTEVVEQLNMEDVAQDKNGDDLLD
ncbi:hypothetical protein [Lysinibacillus sp. fls2-241-R2A-57]|uniref:hypothetical protein n=1 Tax=Lysinibacillus sp. fls2-241-R2A-57 TaxID=3040292 RepID=UPI0025521796|nr:hypothetical protein [Lysinibacillus sp. fls2-241-R2A-57]